MRSKDQLLSTDFIFVDDDSINNLICRLTVEIALGKVNTWSFNDPEEALIYLKNTFITTLNPNKTILLLDINMPGMSGWEFLERFDNLPQHIKHIVQIYILSSSVDERDRNRSYANKNVINFLVKPLTRESVLEICNSTL